MPYDLANVLVIGISSRALFDLEYENTIFETEKLPAFIEYQRTHESEVLKPGTGFHLVESLLKLNCKESESPRRVEVMIFSRNHPDVYLRVSHSIELHRLDITRAFLTGGEPLDRYLKAYKVDLFLSASDDDVRAALRHGIAAGRIYKPPTAPVLASTQIRIAFDGDCVLFSDEAELVGCNGLDAFHRHERENAAIPLPDGPFAKLIRTISQMQGPDPDSTPFRIALVTARNAPSHERAIRTLRRWNVRIDSAAFLGGLEKAPWLKAFQPHIFFDDQDTNCRPASGLVPSARVLPLTETAQPAVSADRRNRFLLICKTYLKRGVGQHQLELEQWYSSNLGSQDSASATNFLNELAESVEGTPVGKERPGKGENQEKIGKFFSFMNALLQKHTLQATDHAD